MYKITPYKKREYLYKLNTTKISKELADELNSEVVKPYEVTVPTYINDYGYGEKVADTILFKGYNPIPTISVILANGCNYNCPNCLEGSPRTHKHPKPELIVEDNKLAVQRAKAANKILKEFAKSHNNSPIQVTVIGGEISCIECETLIQALTEMFIEVPLDQVVLYTNLSRSYEYYYKLFYYVKHNWPDIDFMFMDSLHDGTLTTKKQQQAYFSKHLKLGNLFKSAYSLSLGNGNQHTLPAVHTAMHYYNHISYCCCRPLANIMEWYESSAKLKYYLDPSYLMTQKVSLFNLDNGKATKVGVEEIVDQGVTTDRIMANETSYCAVGFFANNINFVDEEFLLKGSYCAFNEQKLFEKTGYKASLSGSIYDVDVDTVAKHWKFCNTVKHCSKDIKDGNCTCYQPNILIPPSEIHKVKVEVLEL